MEIKDLEAQDDKFDEIQKRFEIDSRADSNNTYAQSVNELLSAVEHLLYSRQFNDGTKWQKHHDGWAEYRLDMQQVANGTIKMPPEKLVEIARRVQADQTNLDLQARGAQQFAQRFGDNNMKAYQQAWNANADTKVFEAMNIVQFVKDPAKQKAELNRLFPDPSQYKDFLTKYQNIKKLSNTGSL